jgi:hypothetical protein
MFGEGGHGSDLLASVHATSDAIALVLDGPAELVRRNVDLKLNALAVIAGPLIRDEASDGDRNFLLVIPDDRAN